MWIIRALAFVCVLYAPIAHKNINVIHHKHAEMSYLCTDHTGPVLVRQMDVDSISPTEGWKTPNSKPILEVFKVPVETLAQVWGKLNVTHQPF